MWKWRKIRTAGDQALRGLFISVRSEQSIHLLLAASFLVWVLIMYFGTSPDDTRHLGMAMRDALVFELLNSGAEILVALCVGGRYNPKDPKTKKFYHPLAKDALDIFSSVTLVNLLFVGWALMTTLWPYFAKLTV